MSTKRFVMLACALAMLALLVFPWSLIANHDQTQGALYIAVTKTPHTPKPGTPDHHDFLPAVLRSEATLTATIQATPTIFVTKTPHTPLPAP